MGLRLDHLVIAVRDRERAIGDYRALGFTVLVGGKHPGRTSHNALVVFEDGAYLELIAWDPPNPAERWSNLLQAHGEGYIDFALLPVDTAAAIESARGRGLALEGPLDGGRVRPDGAQLRWQTARQSTFDLPFLCGDVTPRDLRVPPGEARIHGNGVTGVETVVVAVSDLTTSVARYEALLDAPPSLPPTTLPGAGVRAAAFRLPGTTLLLATPSGVAASGLARRIATQLDGRGDGVCSVALRAGPGVAPGVLDPALAHGAAFEVHPGVGYSLS